MTPTSIRHDLRRRLSVYPRVFLPLMRQRPAHDGHVIGSDTEIVIEGFPRSGNTFAVAAFEFAQGRPVHIARHLHAPAHIIDGVRRGLPVVVLVRDPVEAVSSQVIRHPELSVEAGLREYVFFHRHILRYLDGVSIAPFEQVTADFGAVITAVNQRFGTQFAEFDHTDDNVAAVFEIVDRMDREDRTRRSDEATATVARPTQEREHMKKEVAARFGDAGISDLVTAARSAHAAVLDRAA